MISQLLDRDFFQQKIGVVSRFVEEAGRRLSNNDRGLVRLAETQEVRPSDLEEASEILRTIQNLNDDEDPNLWIPRDRFSSVLQSTLERFYRDQGAMSESASKGLVGQVEPVTQESLATDVLAPVSGLLEQMSTSDPRWVAAFSAARAIAKARGQHKFPSGPPPTVPIAEKARLILVADWGSGLPRARKVANQMRVQIDDSAVIGQRQVIHLGDVYYAGFEEEYTERFLPHWPVKKGEEITIGSWSLNGNHDMYSGGYGYFDLLLADSLFTQQSGSSYFMLENKNWQIFGLDTAYDPPDFRGDQGELFGGQAAWLALKRAAAPHKKAVLLTHHQLFSAYESDSPRVEERLRPVLQAFPVTAWFWGHEHRCAIYDQDPRVKFARLIGHGGIPVTANGKKPDPTRPKVVYEYQDAFPYGLSQLKYFGFCVLDFAADTVTVQYFNEDGVRYYREVIS